MIASTLGIHALLFVVASRTLVEQPVPCLRASLPIEVRLRFEESGAVAITGDTALAPDTAAHPIAQADIPLIQLQTPAPVQSIEPRNVDAPAPLSAKLEQSLEPPANVVEANIGTETSDVPPELRATMDASPAAQEVEIQRAAGIDAGSTTATTTASPVAKTGAGFTPGNGIVSGSAAASQDEARDRSGLSSAAGSAQGNALGGFVPATLRTAVRVPRFLARAAARFSWRGDIEVLVELDAAGRPLAAALHRSSGHTDLDEAARRAALGFTFAPASKDGVAVATRILVPFRF